MCSTLFGCRFDLGDAAPQANGVKVYSSEGEAEEIMIEVDFSWVGNQDVQLTMKPIPKHLGPFSPAGALLSSIIRLRVRSTLCKPKPYSFPLTPGGGQV